jgi:hypothetical protein
MFNIRTHLRHHETFFHIIVPPYNSEQIAKNWDTILPVYVTKTNILQWTICHFSIENIFLVLRKYIRIFLLLSNDHHMNARNLLEHRTYLDIHIMVYKIDKNILAVSLIKCQNSWSCFNLFHATRTVLIDSILNKFNISSMYSGKTMLVPQSICKDIDA